MKKLIFIPIILFTGLLITSCNSNNDTAGPTLPGSIYITSNPSDAEIWLDGVNTFQTTPDTVKNVDEGAHNVTLKLQEYNDTTFTVNVTGGQTSVVTNVVLVSNINTT